MVDELFLVKKCIALIIDALLWKWNFKDSETSIEKLKQAKKILLEK